MEEKKTNLLKFLGFVVVLIALIIYYIANKNDKAQQTINPSEPTSTVEVVVPPVVSGDTTDNIQESSTGVSSQSASSNSQSNTGSVSSAEQNGGSSAKADSYYSNLDNFQAESANDNANEGENPQTELKDGIEVITNPQEGVQ